MAANGRPAPAGDFPPQPFSNHAARFTCAGQLLDALRENCHHSFYEWISREASDSDENYRHQFDVLLGSYFNTITLTNFLELGLSVACICVRFNELAYANNGVVQFAVAHPIIARGDSEVPARPSYTYITKRWARSTLSSSLNICATALELLSGDADDGTRIAEYSKMRALNQLARNLRATLDSFERGTANHVLQVLIAKAPPMPLLRPLSTAVGFGRELNAVNRATIMADIKRAVCQDFFFVNKDRQNIAGGLAGRVIDLINCTLPSVTDARVTHCAEDGRLIDGVIVTTEAVRGVLATVLPSAGSVAVVPAVYSEMVISGTNLVTAIMMGKAVRNFNDAATRLLSFESGSGVLDEPGDSTDESPASSRVPATLVEVGPHLVFLEALEKIYLRTKVPYPLLGRVALTFVFPLGVFKPSTDRYAASASDLAPAPGLADPRQFPPQRMWFYNKDGQMVSVGFEQALPTLAHPVVHGLTAVLDEISSAPWVRDREPAPLGFTIQRLQANNLPRVQMVRFLEAVLGVLNTPYPDATLINRRTAEQFMHYSNPFLPLELHPFFDIYRVSVDLQTPCDEALFFPADPVTVSASPRVINGNIPLPLCSADFRTARGRQLASGHFKLHPRTDAVLETTFGDMNYPFALYIIEAAIHGDEVVFMESQRLVAQCVNSYWRTTHGLAFATSYPMVSYIYHNLAGMIDRECHAVYSDIMTLVYALRAVISRFTLPADPILGHLPEELNHLLTDPAVFPPMMYDCDPIIRVRNGFTSRQIELRTFGDRAPTVATREHPANPEFNAPQTVLHHGPSYSANSRGDWGLHHDIEWTVLSKIFYYAVLPAVSRGRCCSMGVEYEMLYALLNTTRLPATAEDMAAGMSPTSVHHPLHPDNLTPDSFNTLLSNGQLVDVDNEALVAFIAAARRRQVAGTTPFRVSYQLDPGFETLETPTAPLCDGVLYNGLIMMHYAQYDSTAVPSRYFYALPVNGMYADRGIIEASHRSSVCIRTLPEDLPLVPTFMSAEVYRSVRSPSCLYASRAGRETSVSELAYGLIGGYFKTSPVALIHQLRTGFHPGVALTVVREDGFLAENILFARRASESYYLGKPQMTHRAENGGLVIDISQPRTHVDMGLGFTASITPAMLNTPLTDMGNRCQNLFNARIPGQFRHPEVANFVAAETVDCDSTAMPRAAPPLMLPYNQPPIPPGIEHGQQSTCEFIVTPVTTDLRYFYSSANPRGRTGCGVYCTSADPDPDPAAIEQMLYDHGTPDPAYSMRATVNPWASQRFSLGDQMYNAGRGFIVASDYYSPCSKFFTTTRVVERGRCLLRMMSDAAAATSSTTSNTEYQFVAPPGSSELITDPCSLLQEAFPIMSTSDPALLASYAQSGLTKQCTRENHLAQYLIHDASPLAGVLPVGNGGH